MAGNGPILLRTCGRNKEIRGCVSFWETSLPERMSGEAATGVSSLRAGIGWAISPSLAIHLTFSVARPIIARIRLMIQNRITICGSAQPFFSKWWWIGAIRKMRLFVRL